MSDEKKSPSEEGQVKEPSQAVNIRQTDPTATDKALAEFGNNPLGFLATLILKEYHRNHFGENRMECIKLLLKLAEDADLI